MKNRCLAFRLPQISTLKGNNQYKPSVLYRVPLTCAVPCHRIPLREAAQQMRCRDDNMIRTMSPRALRYQARASWVWRESSPFVAQQRREQKRYGWRADVTTEELPLCNGAAAFVPGFTNLEDRIWYLLGNVVLKCQHACHAFLVLVISYSYKPPERQEYF